MPQTLISKSSTMTLEEVIAHLAKHRAVDGLVVFGSASKNILTPSSDYDLLVLLSEMPAPLRVALTYIDHRLADIVFLTTQFIDRFLADDTLTLSVNSFEGSLLRRLPAARIVFDRVGRLEQTKSKLQTEQRIIIASEGEIYLTWFSINYNLRQTKRILTLDDSVYQMTVDLRLLYSLIDLWTGYFRVRKIPWSGEKEAIRYLSVHDPTYLTLFQQCLQETNRVQKVQLYEQLCQLTLEPVGGIWTGELTAIQLENEAELQPQTVEQALTFWEELVTG